MILNFMYGVVKIISRFIEEIYSTYLTFHRAYWNLIFGGLGILGWFTHCTYYQNVDGSHDGLSICPPWEGIRDPKTYPFILHRLELIGVAMLIASSPMILDTILDMCSKSTVSTGYNFHILNGRACYASIIFIFGFLMVFQSNANFFNFTVWCFQISMISIAMFFISVADPTPRTSIKTGLITVWTCCNVFLHNAFHEQGQAHFIINWSIKLYLLYTLYFIFWETQKASHCLYAKSFTNIFSLGFSIRLMLWIMEYYISSDYLDKVVINILVPKCMYVILTVVLTIIPGRILRQQVYTSKDDMVTNTKNAYEGYISHELLTPFNTIFMTLDFCLNEIPVDTSDVTEIALRENLNDARSSCSTIVEILDDFLVHGKVRNGSLSFNKESVNVKDFLSSSINMFTVPARVKKINFQVFNAGFDLSMLEDRYINICSHSIMRYNSISMLPSTADKKEIVFDSDTACIDKATLGQVFRNLMSNAIKFTPEYGFVKVYMKFVPNIKKNPLEEIKEGNRSCITFIKAMYYKLTNDTKFFKKISIYKALKKSPYVPPIVPALVKKIASTEGTYTKSQEGMLVIEIHDNGAGISSETQTRLFKNIVRFNPAELQAGGSSGLGLWISKEVIDMHDGRINVYSDGEGKGTTFHVEIPMTRTITKISKSGFSDSSSSSSSSSASSDSTYSQHSSSLSVSVKYQDGPLTNGTSLRKHPNKDMSISTSDMKNAGIIPTSSKRQLSLMGTDDMPSCTVKPDISNSSKKGATKSSRLDKSSSVLPVKNESSRKVTRRRQKSITSSTAIEENNPVIPDNEITTVNTISPTNSNNNINNEHEALPKTTTLPTTTTGESIMSGGTAGTNRYLCKKMKFLVVDDVQSNRKFLCKLLSQRGHYCEEAENGVQAVNMVKTAPSVFAADTNGLFVTDVTNWNLRGYDAIFMDFVMPELNGPEATRIIRNLGYKGPIIGVTGNARAEDQALFIEEGATDVIIKPLRIPRLLEIMPV